MVKKNEENLVGFEDYLKSQKDIPKKATSSQSRQNASAPELLTFIEDENNRLSKLSDFFDNKLKNSVLYSQTDEIIRKQKTHNEKIKRKLRNHFTSKDSGFQNNMKSLFDNHFKDLS